MVLTVKCWIENVDMVNDQNLLKKKKLKCKAHLRSLIKIYFNSLTYFHSIESFKLIQNYSI